MSGPNYAPPLGTATPGIAANVPESVPNAPPDQTVLVNGLLPTGVVSGNSATRVYLADVLQVDSGPQGQPAQNAVISISGGVPASALQTFKWA
jgi:hypothetical protein